MVRFRGWRYLAIVYVFLFFILWAVEAKAQPGSKPDTDTDKPVFLAAVKEYSNRIILLGFASVEDREKILYWLLYRKLMDDFRRAKSCYDPDKNIWVFTDGILLEAKPIAVIENLDDPRSKSLPPDK